MRRVTVPNRRPLKIFAVDPMLGRTFGNRAQIYVANEKELLSGPIGQRIAVIDYDGYLNKFYQPVDLNDPSILMQGGLEPSESDPRFHQQMVYAVAMKTIENFEHALGYKIKLSTDNHPKLRLFPHAFFGANAFYNKKLNAILFGYFTADSSNPGDNLPGQPVYTCLSSDVITHEMTHKIVDRLRPLFLEPSNEDVFAFHEGFSDIVALFQHFSFQDVLRDQIARTRSDIRTRTPLIELARQFGHATGLGSALRSALDQTPDGRLYKTVFEPHARGSILVAAIFDGFYKTYQRQISDLIHIATGGTGQLPPGDLHPDLVNRIAKEASRTAKRVLDMCIRAFDYLPPIDVTFGDYLRALITADYELIPDDELDMRGAMIEAFRLRGIYPAGVISLAEESLLWDRPEKEDLPSPTDYITLLLYELFFHSALDFNEDCSLSTLNSEKKIKDIKSKITPALRRYAKETKVTEYLKFDPKLRISVKQVQPVFRVAPNGRLAIELIVQFTQFSNKKDDPDLGGLPFRAGATLIIGMDGTVRYVASKPMLTEAATTRYKRQCEFAKLCDLNDSGLAYRSEEKHKMRMKLMADFRNLHDG